MKKILLFLILSLSFYQGVFAWGWYWVITDNVLWKSVIREDLSIYGWWHSSYSFSLSWSFTQISWWWSGLCGIKTDKTVLCSNWRTSTGAFLQISTWYQPEFCWIIEDWTALCMNTSWNMFVPGTAWRHYTQIVSGDGVACGLIADEPFVWYMTCWGNNSSTFPVKGGGGWKKMTIWQNRVCLIDTDDTVKCNTWVGEPSWTFKEIQSWWYYDYFCGIKTDDTLSCWGSQPPVNNNPPAWTYRELAIGQFGSCAVKISDNLIYCWGDNTFNELYPSYNWVYLPVIPESCSDGIKNQNETSIDYGGVCSCYVHDVESGKTLLPYRYNGLGSTDVSTMFGHENLKQLRSWYTSWDFVTTGFRIFNWRADVNQISESGSMLEVLSHLSWSFVQYSSVKPVIEFHLYPWVTFGDEETTDFFSSWSNAINYVRLTTDRGWHMEARLISNVGSNWSIQNVEDSDYSYFSSQSGAVYLPIDKVSRDFKIVFDDNSPTIYTFDWGSYTRTVSSQTVCTAGVTTINGYVNGQITSSTWQVQFVDSVVTTLNEAIINQSGSIVQSEFVCPSDITGLNVPWLGFVSWGFSQHIPLIDYTINVKPFGMLECPLKSIYLFTSKFQ